MRRGEKGYSWSNRPSSMLLERKKFVGDTHDKRGRAPASGLNHLVCVPRVKGEAQNDYSLRRRRLTALRGKHLAQGVLRMAMGELRGNE